MRSDSSWLCSPSKSVGSTRRPFIFFATGSRSMLNDATSVGVGRVVAEMNDETAEV